MAADVRTQTAEVSNNRGAKIRLKVPVQNDVNPDTIHVEAVTTITSGHLWEPAYRSLGNSDHVPGVLLNKHHDFYQKIYQRAAANGYAVEGMVNRPGFTGGQNSRRIARYGTDIKEEDLEAIFA
jgi:hypothetical protein